MYLFFLMYWISCIIFVTISVSHLENMSSLACTNLLSTVSNVQVWVTYILTNCESTLETGEPGRKAKSAMTVWYRALRGWKHLNWWSHGMWRREDCGDPSPNQSGDNQGNSPPIRTWECSGSRRAVCARLWGEWAEAAPAPTSQYPEHRCYDHTQPPWLTDHQPTNSPSALEGEYPVSPRSFEISTDFGI